MPIQKTAIKTMTCNFVLD